jgi:diguanylate cyclase (GGDEF)-like protein
MFANHAGLAIENSRLYEETEYLSKTDWLTKLWNSGELHKTLAKELEKSRITDKNLTVLMIDIDNFKPYNDSVGHRKGDEAIKKIATLLSQRSRKNDFVARYGGEEFTIIMPDTTKKTAFVIAERLKKEVEDTWGGGELAPGAPPLTISIGISTFPVDGADKDNLIHKADIALYEAKRKGKNKVCVYTPHLGKGLFGFKKRT